MKWATILWVIVYTMAMEFTRIDRDGFGTSVAALLMAPILLIAVQLTSAKSFILLPAMML